MSEENRRRAYPADQEISRALDGLPYRHTILEQPLHCSYSHWRHGPLHDVLRPMNEHVVMTYFGPMQRLERRTEGALETVTARRGTITIIPAGSSSRLDIPGAVDVVHLYLPGFFLEQIKEQIDGKPCGEMLRRTGHPDASAARLLSMVSQTLGSRSPIDALLREQLTASLVTCLLKEHAGGSLNLARATGGLSPRALRQALERLDSDCDSDVSLAALAEQAGLSTYHFCRAFKQSTGMPPHAWLRQRRFERATAMLRDPEIPISVIAGDLGYASQTAFTAAFKRHIGTTPSRWRHQQQ